MNVVMAAVLMTATFPGRTQGLGLITEPLLNDCHIGRLDYANINLWATLLGALFCFPAGFFLDRFSLRGVACGIVVLLGLTVWKMSAFTGGLMMLFVLVTLTRALGQSALSVASMTVVGKSTGNQPGFAMGVYSCLLSILFAVAFGVVGNSVTQHGWKIAWSQVAMALLIIATPLTWLFVREQAKPEITTTVPEKLEAVGSVSLREALRSPAFWIFAGGTAMFGLVSSGLGLFNESVLAERGFNQETYHLFLVITTLVALVGQFLCGWISMRWSLCRLMGIGLFLYAAALGMLPFISTLPQLWCLAALIGVAGGMITVLFFAIWRHAFGAAHLGRIQGAAQVLTVLASATGPLLFAKCATTSGSYKPLLLALVPFVFGLGVASWNVRLARKAGI